MSANNYEAMPWKNLTDEWNAALKDFRKRNGRHWHGTLPHSRSKENRHGVDNKECIALIVVDSFQGRPIELGQTRKSNGEMIGPALWSGYPDYWDLKRIIAVPFDHYFRGIKRGGSVVVEDELSEQAQRIVDLHNASLVASGATGGRP